MDTMTPEPCFKDCVGFPNYYQVGSDGSIWRKRESKYSNKHKTDALCTFLDKDGYPFVFLKILGKRYKRMVHRLVAESFLEQPTSTHQVNHRNGIKTDNRIGNLEWCTAKENIHHRDVNGLRKHTNIGEKAGGARFKTPEVIKMRLLYKNGYTQREIASRFGTIQGYVSDIINRKVWKHI